MDRSVRPAITVEVAKVGWRATTDRRMTRGVSVVFFAGVLYAPVAIPARTINTRIEGKPGSCCSRYASISPLSREIIMHTV